MPKAAKTPKAKAGRKPAATPAAHSGGVLRVDKKNDRTFRFVSNFKAKQGCYTGRVFIDKPGVSFIMRVPKGARLPTWADPVEIIPDMPAPIPITKGLPVIDDETGEEGELAAGEGEQVGAGEDGGAGADELEGSGDAGVETEGAHVDDV